MGEKITIGISHCLPGDNVIHSEYERTIHDT